MLVSNENTAERGGSRKLCLRPTSTGRLDALAEHMVCNPIRVNIMLKQMPFMIKLRRILMSIQKGKKDTT